MVPWAEITRHSPKDGGLKEADRQREGKPSHKHIDKHTNTYINKHINKDITNSHMIEAALT